MNNMNFNSGRHECIFCPRDCCIASDSDNSDDTDDYCCTTEEDYSSDEDLNSWEKCFISYYNDKKQQSIVVVSNLNDILDYQNNFNTKKNQKERITVKQWDEIKIHIYECGFLQLKQCQPYIKKLEEYCKTITKTNFFEKKLQNDLSILLENITANISNKKNAVDNVLKNKKSVKASTPDSTKKKLLQSMPDKQTTVAATVLLNKAVSEEKDLKSDLKSNNNKSKVDELSSKRISKKKEKKQKQQLKKLKNQKNVLNEDLNSKKNIKTPKNLNIMSKKDKLQLIKTEKIISKENSLSTKEPTKTLTKDLKTNISDQEDMSNHTNSTDEECEEPVLTDPEAIPSFYSKVFLRAKKSVKSASKKKPGDILKTGLETDSDDDFKTKKKRKDFKEIVSQSNGEKSDDFGEMGIEMVLKNNFSQAINNFHKALYLKNSDVKHYLNRSYCYLRIDNHKNALVDAQYVIQNTKNIAYLFIANLRAGQACFFLKKYQQAEAYYNEALHIYPDSHHAKRELMRVKITRIVEQKFEERDAIFALDLYPNTLDALKYLNDTITSKCKKEDDPITFDDDFDDRIYESDEDSTTEMLNQILNYNPNNIKICNVAEPLFSWLKIKEKQLITQTLKESPKTTVVKNTQVASPSIWVGSLTKNITDSMLKKAFKQYGPVVSIHRPDNTQYCFVNFEKCEDASKVLSSSNKGKFRLNGVDLVVRPGIRK